MITRLKELIIERDYYAMLAECDQYKCCDEYFMAKFEAVCLEILELSNKLYPERDRAVIEWDGLNQGSFVGDHKDIIMDAITNEYNRN